MDELDMSKITTLLIDIDGVLTDGKLYIDHTGEKMFKAFHSRDVRAIREFVNAGFRVVLVTADDWEGGSVYAEKVGAEIIIQRDKSLVSFTNYAAVADDAWDVRMLKNANVKFAPFDCDESVQKVPNINILQTEGGKGVIAELARLLL